MEPKYIVAAVAFGIPIAGVGHALHAVAGLPLWAVVPLVGAGWAVVGWALMRKRRREHEAADA
jgi:hypothetical protein